MTFDKARSVNFVKLGAAVTVYLSRIYHGLDSYHQGYLEPQSLVPTTRVTYELREPAAPPPCPTAQKT